jgi:hypothetical protein
MPRRPSQSTYERPLTQCVQGQLDGQGSGGVQEQLPGRTFCCGGANYASLAAYKLPWQEGCQEACQHLEGRHQGLAVAQVVGGPEGSEEQQQRRIGKQSGGSQHRGRCAGRVAQLADGCTQSPGRDMQAGGRGANEYT